MPNKTPQNEFDIDDIINKLLSGRKYKKKNNKNTIKKKYITLYKKI